jgi:hypothetical protein
LKQLANYSLYTQVLANFFKAWGVASEDIGSRESCSLAPMDGFTAVLERHIPFFLSQSVFQSKEQKGFDLLVKIKKLIAL